MTRTLSVRRASALLLVAALACGDDSDAAPSPSLATVEFVYVARTSLDPAVDERFPACVDGVGPTHIHPSWRGFALVPMTAAGDRWTITFVDVPPGVRQRIRVSDANACAENPTGAATANIFANGVRLTEVVDTPGTGTEPGLAFTVAADGQVTP